MNQSDSQRGAPSPADLGLGDSASTIAAYIKRFRTQPPMRSQDRLPPKETSSFWWKRDAEPGAQQHLSSLHPGSFEGELSALRTAGASLDDLAGKPRALDTLTPSLDALMAELELDQTQALNARADAILAKYGCMRSSVDSEASSLSSSSSLEGLALIEDAPCLAVDPKSTKAMDVVKAMCTSVSIQVSEHQVKDVKEVQEVEDAKGVKDVKDVACQGEVTLEYSFLEEESGGVKEDVNEESGGEVVGEEADTEDIILEYLHAQVKQLEDEYKLLQEREKEVLERLHCLDAMPVEAEALRS